MEAYIAGWEVEGDGAKKFIGKDPTSELKKAKVYFTKRRDYVYAHSNFIKTGCRHPTKLITNQSRSLEQVVANLIATKEDLAAPYFRHDLWRAMVDDFVFFIDEMLLLEARYSFLDFSGLSNVYVIVQGGDLKSFKEWEEVRQPSKLVSNSIDVRRTVLLAIEIAAVCVAAVFGILWVMKPTGVDEPITFLCLLVGSTVVEIIRRNLPAGVR